jgi:DNA-binding beta-propeller fold protein YncE
MNNPQGLAFDQSGNLYVGSEGSNSILKIDPAGNMSTFASTPLPIGLAFDKAGNLYVANNAAYTVTEFNPSGNGSVFLNLRSEPYYPNFLAFDSSGNLYIVGDGGVLESDPHRNMTVFAVAPSGSEFMSVAVQPSLNLRVLLYYC